MCTLQNIDPIGHPPGVLQPLSQCYSSAAAYLFIRKYLTVTGAKSYPDIEQCLQCITHEI